VESFGPLFGPVERRTFEWSTTHTAESFLELVKSRSYYLLAGDEARKTLEAELGKVLPQTATFELPYVTYAYIGRKR
jgi:hypothetical protein